MQIRNGWSLAFGTSQKAIQRQKESTFSGGSMNIKKMRPVIVTRPDGIQVEYDSHLKPRAQNI